MATFLAALLGLAGVVVGALLAGAGQQRLEARKVASQFQTAGRLIADELGDNERRLEASRSTYFPTGYPTQAWKARASDLALRLSSETWKLVADAYSRIELWNIEQQLHEGAGEASTRKPNESAVAPDVSEIKKAVEQLREELDRDADQAFGPQPKSPFRPAVIAGIIAVLAILFAATSAITVNDANASTVAEAVAKITPPNTVVDCDPDKDDYLCNVRYLNRSALDCAIQDSIFAAPLDFAVSSRTSDLSICAASPESDNVPVSVSDDKLQASFDAVAAVRARLQADAARGPVLVQVPTPRKPWWYLRG